MGQAALQHRNRPDLIFHVVHLPKNQTAATATRACTRAPVYKKDAHICAWKHTPWAGHGAGGKNEVSLRATLLTATWGQELF